MKSIFNAVINYAFLYSHFPMFICLWVLPSSTCSSWLQKSKRYLYGSRMKIKNCLFVSLLQFFQFPYNFLNKQQTRLVLCNNTCSCWLPFYMEQFVLFHIFFFLSGYSLACSHAPHTEQVSVRLSKYESQVQRTSTRYSNTRWGNEMLLPFYKNFFENKISKTI